MIVHKIKNILLLLAVAVVGFLIGVWLSPQEPITSSFPTQSESKAYKDSLNTLALISGISTSIFTFITGYIFKISNVYIITATLFIGMLYVGFDLARFGQLTFSNLTWILNFSLGGMVGFVIGRILTMFYKGK